MYHMRQEALVVANHMRFGTRGLYPGPPVNHNYLYTHMGLTDPRVVVNHIEEVCYPQTTCTGLVVEDFIQDLCQRDDKVSTALVKSLM